MHPARRTRAPAQCVVDAITIAESAHNLTYLLPPGGRDLDSGGRSQRAIAVA